MATKEKLDLVVITGSAHHALAESIAGQLGSTLGQCRVERFPDGEIHVQVSEQIRGRDVFIVQPTGLFPGENLLELLLLSDACRRAGADRTTAVIPYFGYSRQDRRSKPGEAFGARVVADVLDEGHFACLVTVHLHSSGVEACLRMPVEHLSAAPLLAEAIRPYITKRSVIVSPDFGAVKLAEEYARLLELPMAIVHKTRLTGSEVRVRGLVGEVHGRAPIIVDDIVSTGGTIVAAAQVLSAQKALPDITVVATHALLVAAAVETLKELPLHRFVTTDTLPPKELPFPSEVVGVAPLLSQTIRKLHQSWLF